MDRVVSLALAACVGNGVGCTVLLDLDGYTVDADGGTSEQQELLPDGRVPIAPAVAVFDHYRFERGEASFSVAAAEGLLINDTGAGAVAGSFGTTRGGGIELGEDGGFRYTPPGEPGVFWGDDSVEYEVVSDPPSRARVRLTVAAPSFELDRLSGSGAGFGIAGANAFDAVSSFFQGIDAAGDVNGDGFEDIVVGVPGPSSDLGNGFFVSSGRGASVIFGKADAAQVSLLDLGAESPSGFTILGNGNDLDYDTLGGGVAGVGDVNGDGLDDVLVSQIGYQEASALDVFEPLGMTYVVFGKRDGAPVDAAAVRAGMGGGFALRSPPDYRFLGFGIGAAGDVNGDGLADVMLSTPATNSLESSTPGFGVAYVVFGKVGTEPIELATLGQDGRGFEIRGDIDGGWFGDTAAGVGDLNGDGLDDVAINSSGYPSAEVARGRLAIVFGKLDTEPVVVAELGAQPARGLLIYGADDQDSRLDARPGGDINRDGFDDLLIGAPFASFGPPVALGDVDAGLVDAGSGDAGDELGGDVGAATPLMGVTYVFYGSPNPTAPSLRALEGASAAGFAVGGVELDQRIGVSVGSGDINGDGFSDVLLGTEPTFFQGRAYALLGSPSTPTLSLPTPGDPAHVLEITGTLSDGLGRPVASGADVNADGLDDLLVGAPFYPNAPQGAGGLYVAFGWDISDALGERDRALIGGAEDDTFELPAQPIVIARGGHGSDTLLLGSRQEPLDLRERGRYESIEVIDARGGGPQVIVLDDAALRGIPQNQPGLAFSLARRLAILGDAEDTLRFDMTGYTSRGGGAGRVVYGRAGRFYGLEVSSELRIEAP